VAAVYSDAAVVVVRTAKTTRNQLTTGSGRCRRSTRRSSAPCSTWRRRKGVDAYGRGGADYYYYDDNAGRGLLVSEPEGTRTEAACGRRMFSRMVRPTLDGESRSIAGFGPDPDRDPTGKGSPAQDRG